MQRLRRTVRCIREVRMRRTQITCEFVQRVMADEDAGLRRTGHSHRCRLPRLPRDGERRLPRRKPPGGFGAAVHEFYQT